ncbi:MAG TPA: cyclic-di-AMP receptor, partial [Candidatus Limnocylindrales bacterium]
AASYTAPDRITAPAKAAAGDVRAGRRPRRGMGLGPVRSPPILRPVKLVVAIVHNEDAGALVDALLDRDFRATRLHSSGGFLKQSNATVILGVDDPQVDDVLDIVRETCHARTQVVNPMPPIMEPGEFFMPYPLEVEVGGATVFVLPVERFERI